MAYMYMETLEVRIKTRVETWLNGDELYERPPDPAEEEKVRAAAAAAEEEKVRAAAAAAEAEVKRLAAESEAKKAKELADAAAEEQRKKYAKTRIKVAATAVSAAASLAKKAKEKAQLAEEARLAEEKAKADAKALADSIAEAKASADAEEIKRQNSYQTQMAKDAEDAKAIADAEEKGKQDEVLKTHVAAIVESTVDSASKNVAAKAIITEENAKADGINTPESPKPHTADDYEPPYKDPEQAQLADWTNHRLAEKKDDFTKKWNDKQDRIREQEKRLEQKQEDEKRIAEEKALAAETETARLEKEAELQKEADRNAAELDAQKETARIAKEKQEKEQADKLIKPILAIQDRLKNDKLKKQIFDRLRKASAEKFSGGTQLAYSNEYKHFNILDSTFIDAFAHHLRSLKPQMNTPDIKSFINGPIAVEMTELPTVYTSAEFVPIQTDSMGVVVDASNNQKFMEQFESIFDNQIRPKQSYTGIEKLLTQETRGIRFDLYFTILAAVDDPSEKDFESKLKEQFDADFESIRAKIEPQNDDDTASIHSDQTEQPDSDSDNDDDTASIHSANSDDWKGGGPLTLDQLLAKLYILYRRLKPYWYFISKIDTESDISSAFVEDKNPNAQIVKRQHQLLIIPYTYRIVMREENSFILTESFVHSAKQVLHVIKVVLSEPTIYYMMTKPPMNTMTKRPPSPKLYTARVEPILPVPDENATTNGLSREDTIQQNATKMNGKTIQDVREANLGIHETYVFTDVEKYKTTTEKTVDECQYVFGRDDLEDVYKHIPSFIKKTME